MKLFFKKKIAGSKANQHLLTNHIVNGIVGIKRVWADWMSKKINGLSAWTKWLLLFCFCIITAGVSLLNVIQSFSDKTFATITVTRIKPPLIVNPVGLASQQKSKTSNNIDKRVSYKIFRFKIYMDSLARSPSSKKIYDSIIQNRPGLMDSVIQAEKVYQSQFK